MQKRQHPEETAGGQVGLARGRASRFSHALALWLLLGLGLGTAGTRAGAAQDLPAGMAADAPHKYDLSGTVVNSATGEAIAHALVQFPTGATRFAFTDVNGQFRLRDLPEGPELVTARKPGFFGPQELHQNAGRQQMVTIGPNLLPVVLQLVPEGVIFGTVTGSGGEVVERGQMLLKRQQMVNGRKVLEVHQQTNTGENGEFRFASLQPGFYSLSCDPAYSNRSLGGAPHQSGYRAAYYPGVTDAAAAVLIEVRPGRKIDASFKLKPDSVYRISGVVDGTLPGRAFGLSVGDADGDPVSAPYRSGPAGSFEIQGVSAGSYVISAHSQDEQGQAMSAFLPVTVAGDMADLHLTVQPSAAIPVVVRRVSVRQTPAPETDSPPREPQSVTFYSGPIAIDGQQQRSLTSIDVSISLTPRSGPRQEVTSTIEGTDEQRALVVHAPPGRYTAEITPYGSWYVQSARYGSTDLLREDLVVAGGADKQPFEIVLRDDLPQLKVKVEGAGDERVVLTVLVPEGTTSRPPQVHQHGLRHEIGWGPVAPGAYILYAFDNIDDLEYANPEALSPYSSKAVHFELHPGEEKTVNLDLINRSEP